MKSAAFACMFAFTLSPAMAASNSVFDGTWKELSDSAKFAGKPVSLSLKDGVFACNSCLVPFHVKADGADQPVSGQIGYDTLAVKVENAGTIVETDKLKGQLVEKDTITVDASGNTLTNAWNRIENGNSTSGTATLRRKGPAPAGAHAVSGSWLAVSLANVSDNDMLMTFKADGENFALSTPAGLSYHAKLGGPAVPFRGDPHVQTVSVKSLGANKVVETDMRDGKPVEIVTMTVAPDNRTMTILYDNKAQNRTATFTAVKQ